MTAPDHIIVGSGINALVCAAILGGKGRKVLVLERNDRIGGCIRTEEITAPGFVHDVMATTFVLFITSPAYAALAADLGRHGLEFCNTKAPTGVLRPDGSHLIQRMDRATNIAAIGQPGEDVSHLRPAGAKDKAVEVGSAASPETKLPQVAPATPVETQAGAAAGISPRAKNLAQQKGLETAILQGSGPGGRILSTDLDRVDAPHRTAAPGGMTLASAMASSSMRLAASSARLSRISMTSTALRPSARPVCVARLA